MGRHIILFIVLILLLLLALVLQIFMGSVSIPFEAVLSVFTGGNDENEVWRNIVLQSRLPGALAAMLAGAGLSVSGLQMQTLFRNPVAGPYVLGISSGASLGVAVYLMGASAFSSLSMFHLLGSWGIIISASVGAFAIFVVSVLITHRIRDVVAILIIGLMLGAGISAFIEILQSFSGNEALKHYVLWTFGSFRYVDMVQVSYMTLVVAIGIFFSLAVSKQLNILLLGEIYAHTSGVDITLMKYFIVFCTSLLAGCITAFCGPIGFVGLAVPHIVRRLFRTYNHNILTPACAITGGIICCFCNIIASTPGTESALPINAVTSLFGAPVVIWIIMNHKKG